MKTTLETKFRFARLLTLIPVIAVASWACSDAQSREAPADAEVAAEQGVDAEDEAQAPSQEEAQAPSPAEPPMAEEPPPPAPQPREEAPQPAPEPEPEPEPMVVSAGTTMAFAVEEEISTDTYQEGDFFVASLTEAVLDSRGELVLDIGTPSEWRVTQSSTEDGQALLAVELRSINVGGEWTPVVATVSEAELDTDDPDSGGETAAKIGVGAAAGALVGQILGKDTESTLKGAGVGAVVGTAVALATKGGSAKLPAGSILTVELDEPMTIY